MKGDLHLHSYYSDGFYPPAVVMQKAFDAGCRIVSLTDHDTIDGLPEAEEAAGRLGMRFVPGVEISSLDPVTGAEVHILGYRFRADCPSFVSFIASQKRKRRERSERLLQNLAERGITFPPHTFDSCVERELSRTHIAAAMVQAGYETDFHTAIAKWLHKGTPTFVPMEGAPPDTAIEAIHAANGLAVLAHPVRLDLDPYERTALIRRLAAAGLDGIEAVYKRSSRSAVHSFRTLAKELGLLVTAGADYHGEGNEILPRPQEDI